MDLSLASQIEFARRSVEIRKLLNEVSVDGLELKLDIDYEQLSDRLSDISVAKATGYYLQISSKKASYDQFDENMSDFAPMFSKLILGETLSRIRSTLSRAEEMKQNSEKEVPITEFEYDMMQRFLHEVPNSLFQVFSASRSTNENKDALKRLMMSIRDAAMSCFRVGYQVEIPILNATITGKMAKMAEEQTEIAKSSEKVANRMDVMTKVILVATVITTVLTLIPFIGSFAGYLYQFVFTALHLFIGLL